MSSLLRNMQRRAKKAQRVRDNGVVRVKKTPLRFYFTRPAGTPRAILVADHKQKMALKKAARKGVAL